MLRIVFKRILEFQIAHTFELSGQLLIIVFIFLFRCLLIALRAIRRSKVSFEKLVPRSELMNLSTN
jgi:hypothetical protein